MATKKEVFESAIALCEANKASDALVAGLTDLLAPKSGGASINLDEVTRKDEEGNVTEILCSVSNVWLPATVEYFYAEKAEGKGINGLKRVSKQGESIRKAATKVLNATEKAIMTDILSGEMTPKEGQKALTAAKAVQPDFSKVGLIEEDAE